MTRFDRCADDFREQPWLYPGTPPQESGLLLDDQYVPLKTAPHRRAGRPDILDWSVPSGGRAASALLSSDAPHADGRVLVVAIGSNCSPAVMRRKFSQQGVATATSFLRADLRGIAVGHSAHISRPGYVPFAPFAEPNATTEVFASLLDTSQIRAIDRTEPNYTRTRLTNNQAELTLESGEKPESFYIYVSRRGLLKGEHGKPVPAGPQSGIFRFLLKHSPALARSPSTMELKHMMLSLAADESRRHTLSQSFADDDLVAPSGLEGSQQPSGTRDAS